MPRPDDVRAAGGGASFVSHYDPTDHTFTFVNEDFDLALLYGESQAIRGIADKWAEAVTLGRIQPPFA